MNRSLDDAFLIDRNQFDTCFHTEIAASHHELRPDAPAWTALRVVRRLIVVVDRKPTGEVRTEVLAQWSAR